MELLPCPFCSGEDIGVRVNGVYVGNLEWKVETAFCGCLSCGIGYKEETEAKATEAWNRRVSRPPVDELLRVIEDECGLMEENCNTDCVLEGSCKIKAIKAAAERCK
jgi:hypothetical protein